MSGKELTHVVGTFLIQAEGAFLNGWGTEGEGEHAITKPKTMSALGIRYDGSTGPVKIPYVSAQAWKRWLRDTFADEYPSEDRAVMKTTKINKAGNTIKIGIEPDPIKYAEADIFGFMKTEERQGKTKEVIEADDDQDGDDGSDTKGRSKVQPAIRTSPFQSSILKSIRNIGWDSTDQAYAHPKVVAFVAIESILLDLSKKESGQIKKATADKITLILEEARQQTAIDSAISLVINKLNELKTSQKEDEKKLSDAANQINSASSTSLGYKTQFYNTQLQGIFGLAYSRLGVFRNEGDRIELAEEYQKEHQQILNEEKTSTGKIFRLKDNHRKERATNILKALSVMRGGAKQAQFGAPVHPQVLILAGLTSGNLIFNNILEDSANGPKIKIATLDEVLKDYTPRLASNVYIGIRTGYLDQDNEKELRKWATDKKCGNKSITICTPLEAADRMAMELPQ